MPRKYAMTPLVEVDLYPDMSPTQRNVLHSNSTTVLWYFTDKVVGVGNAESVCNLRVEIGETMQMPTAVAITLDEHGVICTYDGPIPNGCEFCIEGPVPGIEFENGGILEYPLEGPMIDD